MDEQRIGDYLNLIQALLSCPGGEEAEILAAHQELIDAGLLLVMEQVADSMAQEGNDNTAEFLRDVARQLSEALGLSSSTPSSSSLSNPESQLDFLLQVLQATSDSDGEPQGVYPLLEKNLEQLDANFPQVLQAWATHRLSEVEPDIASSIAGFIFDFSKLIQQFPLGSRANNLEIAIAAYKVALTVFTRSRFPEDWAVTQYNLGNAYRDRILGEKAENLELAISCYTEALEEFTRSRFPQQWAVTQNNLGIAYSNRICGEKAENLELAIHCYTEALKERTRSRFPQQWAITQNNLGNAYGNRILGEKAENLELAIGCYRKALQVTTPITLPLDCLQTGRNLGNLAFTAGMWDKAIEGYAAAIDAVEQSRTWATSESGRQEILAESIYVYENMVQACVNAGQLDKAIEYVERSRSKRLADLMASNDLYKGGEIPQDVQKWLQEYEALQQQIDDIRFNNNSDNNRELVGTATRSRAALEAYNETIANLEAQKQQVWEQLRKLDPVLAAGEQVSAPNFAAMQQLIEEPTTAILSFYTTDDDTYIFVLRKNQINCHKCPGEGLNNLQKWLFDNWLKFYVSNRQKTEAWLHQMNAVLKELAARLQLTNLISQHLDGIEELILVPHLYLHQIPFAALPILPSPLKAEKLDVKTEFLGDKFLIRYVPSCQVLEFCKNRPSVETLVDVQQYGTVEDATEDLICASFECNKIAELYNINESQRLKGRSGATVREYRKLAQKVQVLHSSHHAQSRLDNPLESVLLLGDGTITLGQLMTPGWRLPHLFDVFLSCCETGLGVTQITDDILTISTGFLCAGERSVVSTLWSVDDLATALFSIFYYQHRQPSQTREPKSRPAALKAAQEELRTLTGDKLATDYQPLSELLEEKLKQAVAAQKDAKVKLEQVRGTQAEQLWDAESKQRAKVVKRLYNAKKRLESLYKESHPFSHPFYWAAFTCQGLR
jgi:CHAT domain-containing protein